MLVPCSIVHIFKLNRSKHTVGRTGLALAVVAVVVTNEERGLHVDRVGDGLAETVSGKRHDEWFDDYKYNY